MNSEQAYMTTGQGGGTGALSYGAQAQQPAPTPSFTDALSGRLNNLIDIVGDCRGTLASLSDRVLGSIPRGVGGESAAKPNGQAAELLALLDRIIETASEARDESRNLSSRL